MCWGRGGSVLGERWQCARGEVAVCWCMVEVAVCWGTGGSMLG